MTDICIFQDCNNPTVNQHNTTMWCSEHYGLYRHKCSRAGCRTLVLYNDEPWCFTHSPDEGSSVKGYNAYKMSIVGFADY